jgi:raffinose/stachyose/melibiose transport system permease protein
VLISPLAAGYLFRGILDPNGPLSQALGWVVGHDVSIAWLGNVYFTVFVIALVQVWKSIGIYMLVYIAGLNAIPDSLIQAAQVECASSWQIFRYVKFPLLAPAFTFNLVLSVIGSLQTFELVVSLTQGGPGDATAVLNYLVWQTYSSGAYGYAATINLALFLLIFAISIPLVIGLRRREIVS